MEAKRRWCLAQGSRFHCVRRYSAEIRNLHYLDFVLKLELLEGAPSRKQALLGRRVL
jgi:hypothetical protein